MGHGRTVEGAAWVKGRGFTVFMRSHRPGSREIAAETEAPLTWAGDAQGETDVARGCGPEDTDVGSVTHAWCSRRLMEGTGDEVEGERLAVWTSAPGQGHGLALLPSVSAVVILLSVLPQAACTRRSHGLGARLDAVGSGASFGTFQTGSGPRATATGDGPDISWSRSARTSDATRGDHANGGA